MFKTHTEEIIKEKLAELKPLNYNQFRWWRRWDSKNTPLLNQAPLLDKIQNGDYEFSHYFWQAQFSELELNKKLTETKDTQHWIEVTQLERARRKRLWEDFEKDEAEKLKAIEKEFTKTFKISKEEYNSELENFDGTLEEFYIQCKSKFGMYNQIKSKRGRPPKIK